jgi:glycine/D-amino acid oxidase-like deaminating enzyme
MQKGIWLKKNNIKNTYPYLYKNIECDVVVVGGGICGAITAYFLAKDGFKVAVIEKNLIGYNTTCVSSACITDFIDELYTRSNLNKEKNIERKLLDLKKKANSLLDEIIVDINENDYLKRTDYLILNTKMFQKPMIKSEINMRKSIGEKVELNEFNTGINIKQGARMIDSYKFTSKIFEYIASFPNVSIFENTELKDLKSFYDYVEIKTQNNFKIKANSLILTTGIENIQISSIQNIEMYKRFSIAFKTNLQRKMCIKLLNDIPVYLRCDENGNTIISGIDTRYTFKMDNNKYVESLEKENEKKLKSIIYKLFPKVEVSDEIFSYSGNIYTSKDKLPIICEIESIPNVYLNIGMGSSSISQMLIGADILKDAIKGYYKKEMNLFKINR